MWPSNIILPEVREYILDERKKSLDVDSPYPLHRYIHHGLSSQALLFNLVGPLVTRKNLDPLRMAFEARTIPWPEGHVEAFFEMEDRTVFNEDTAQPTSIDLVIRGEKSDKWLFVESKFTEGEFGGCSLVTQGDCEGKNPVFRKNPPFDFKGCYLHHIGRKYWTQMIEHDFLDGPLSSSPFCPLANYYQFFREVLFSIHFKGYFVLMHDERNSAFVASAEGLPERGIFPLMVSLLPDPLKMRVKRVTIQEIFAQVRQSPMHQDWIGEFASKYDM